MKDFNYLPLAADNVSGLQVGSEVPNESSISSSLNNYEVLKGIREVSMEYFTYSPPYSVSEFKRTENLRDLINQNKYISPLIVVWDNQGLYILEGGHRFDALNMLEIKSFPALVVKDLESILECE